MTHHDWWNLEALSITTGHPQQIRNHVSVFQRLNTTCYTVHDGYIKQKDNWLNWFNSQQKFSDEWNASKNTINCSSWDFSVKKKLGSHLHFFILSSLYNFVLYKEEEKDKYSWQTNSKAPWYSNTWAIILNRTTLTEPSISDVLTFSEATQKPPIQTNREKMSVHSCLGSSVTTFACFAHSATADGERENMQKPNLLWRQTFNVSALATLQPFVSQANSLSRTRFHINDTSRKKNRKNGPINIALTFSKRLYFLCAIIWINLEESEGNVNLNEMLMKSITLDIVLGIYLTYFLVLQDFCYNLIMCFAFRDSLLHTTVVTSGYLSYCHLPVSLKQ